MRRLLFLFALTGLLAPLISCQGTIDKVEDKYEDIDQMAHDLKAEVQLRADMYFGESIEASKDEEGIQDLVYQKRENFTDKQWEEMVKINKELVKGYKELEKVWKKYQKHSSDVEKYLDQARSFNAKAKAVGSVIGSSLKIGAGLVG